MCSKMDLEGVIGKWSLSVTFHTVLVFNGPEFPLSFLLIPHHKVLRQVFNLLLQIEFVLEDPIFYS